jgi:hypothetical protein
MGTEGAGTAMNAPEIDHVGLATRMVITDAGAAMLPPKIDHAGLATPMVTTGARSDAPSGN